MKDAQCYELFGGIALKNHAFSFSCQTAYKSFVIEEHLKKLRPKVIVKQLYRGLFV